MNIIELIKQFKAIFHTFIRILPLGLYSFAYLQSAVFKDARGGLILLGLIINDIIGYVYKTYFNFIPNDNCAIFGNVGQNETLGFLPNAHEEVIAFFTAFIFSNMWDEFNFDLIPFVFLTILCLNPFIISNSEPSTSNLTKSINKYIIIHNIFVDCLNIYIYFLLFLVNNPPK